MCGVSSFMIVMVFFHIIDLNELHLAQYTDKLGNIHNASARTILQVPYDYIHILPFLFIINIVHSQLSKQVEPNFMLGHSGTEFSPLILL